MHGGGEGLISNSYALSKTYSTVLLLDICTDLSSIRMMSSL